MQIASNKQIRNEPRASGKIKNCQRQCARLLESAKEYKTIDANKAMEYAHESFQLAERFGNFLSMVDSAKRIAYTHISLNALNQAQEWFDIALELCNKIQDEPKKANVMSNMANVFQLQGQYERALDVLKAALAIQRRYDQFDEIPITLYRLGTTYTSLEEYDKAIAAYQESLECLGRRPKAMNRAMVLSQIANIYVFTGELDRALEYLTIALDEHRSAQDLQGEALTLGTMGIAYGQLNQLDLSLKCFQGACEIYERIHNESNIIYALVNLSNLYLLKGDISSGCSHAHLAYEKGRVIEDMRAKFSSALQYATSLNRATRYRDALSILLNLFPNPCSEKLYERGELLTQVVAAHEGLNQQSDALMYHKQLLEIRLLREKNKHDDNLKKVQFKLELQYKEMEKEHYRLKAIELEREAHTRSEDVVKLGHEIMQRTEFLSSMRKKIEFLIPNANGCERALRSFIKEINEKIASGDAHRQFEEALKQLHSEFLEVLTERYPELTSTERKVCSLIKLDMNSQQIADLLFTSIRTIEGHRLNIRKKLKLQTPADIGAFLRYIIPAPQVEQ
jgi:tetratricopeptide (TPR) repeat protein